MDPPLHASTRGHVARKKAIATISKNRSSWRTAPSTEKKKEQKGGKVKGTTNRKSSSNEVVKHIRVAACTNPPMQILIDRIRVKMQKAKVEREMRNKQGGVGSNEGKCEGQMGNSAARVTGREQMQSEGERRIGGKSRNDLIANLNAAAQEPKRKINMKVGEQQAKVDCKISELNNRIQEIRKERQAKEISRGHGNVCQGMPIRNFATARRTHHNKKEYEAISRIIKAKGKGT